jgi:hypothetical protein
MPELHPDLNCDPGFGSMVGSARASVTISLSIPSIFRPAPGPSLAGYTDGHQPTFTLYGKMLILDPGHSRCWPSSSVIPCGRAPIRWEMRCSSGPPGRQQLWAASPEPPAPTPGLDHRRNPEALTNRFTCVALLNQGASYSCSL